MAEREGVESGLKGFTTDELAADFEGVGFAPEELKDLLGVAGGKAHAITRVEADFGVDGLQLIICGSDGVSLQFALN